MALKLCPDSELEDLIEDFAEKDIDESRFLNQFPSRTLPKNLSGSLYSPLNGTDGCTSRPLSPLRSLPDVTRTEEEKMAARREALREGKGWVWIPVHSKLATRRWPSGKEVKDIVGQRLQFCMNVMEKILKKPGVSQGDKINEELPNKFESYSKWYERLWKNKPAVEEPSLNEHEIELPMQPNIFYGSLDNNAVEDNAGEAESSSNLVNAPNLNYVQSIVCGELDVRITTSKDEVNIISTSESTDFLAETATENSVDPTANSIAPTVLLPQINSRFISKQTHTQLQTITSSGVEPSLAASAVTDTHLDSGALPLVLDAFYHDAEEFKTELGICEDQSDAVWNRILSKHFFVFDARE